MFWLKTGVGVEVAVGGGSVALPLVHALHRQGAPQKHPSLTPNSSCYHFHSHMTFPQAATPSPGQCFTWNRDSRVDSPSRICNSCYVKRMKPPMSEQQSILVSVPTREQEEMFQKKKHTISIPYQVYSRVQVLNQCSKWLHNPPSSTRFKSNVLHYKSFYKTFLKREDIPSL